MVKRSLLLLRVCALRLGVVAFRLGAALRPHVEYVDEERLSTSTGRWIRRQGAPRYDDKEQLGTSTRNDSVRRQGATVRVPLGLRVAVRQHEVEYKLHYGWYASTHRIVRSQCEIARVLRSDLNFPSATREFTWSIYSGPIPSSINQSMHPQHY